MSREIKFRAWDKNQQKMIEVDHLTWGQGDIEHGVLSEINEEMPEWFELTQYTGLKDKNGKPIYEGDIVKWGENIETVFYLVSEAAFSTETSCLDSCMEVIGNIYENN